MEARDGGHGSTTDAAQQAEHAAQQARQIARDAERGATTADRPNTERERGGREEAGRLLGRNVAGVHRPIRRDEFATHTTPMWTAERFDFVVRNPREARGLDDLEVETDQTLDQLDAQLEAARLTPQEAAIIKAMRDRQLLARNRAQASTNRRNAPLPRAARLRTEEAPPADTLRGRARAAAEKRGRSLSRRPDDAMDTSVERSKSVAREPAAKKRRRTLASRRARCRRAAPRNEQGLDGQRPRPRAPAAEEGPEDEPHGRAARPTEDGPALIRWMNEGKRQRHVAPPARAAPCATFSSLLRQIS